MRTALLAACLSLLSTTALAQPAGPAAPSDPNAPKGKLSDAARPVDYRLDFTIDPDKPTFSGHDEIDIQVKAPTRSLYMHGRDLTVSKAVAMVGGKPVAATYTQVDPTGVVRLDFASPLPAGAVTLAFDYTGKFTDSPSGLYRIQVAGKWYSWTQFESIDARAAYPSFDEPGFKTPFSVTVTTPAANKAISNAPEASVTTVGTMQKHVFQPTRPLPTYLVAMATGPFLHPMGTIPADPQRATPLPLGVVGTQAQAGKLDYVMAETPRIVELLEKYFNQPFPFPKLDQIGSPVMPGAMENAGADTYGDGIIMLDAGADTVQKQTFGMVVAHELSHQWFGDLVSPAWWDDIWLNESFANWMGYRIGNEWRPELNIGVGGLAEGFNAMNIDALEVGRPIHQAITENSQIDAAFDTITYGKGGQVIAMIAAYLGDEKFRDGVRLHLSRHMYGNASTDQFFQALADGAHDQRIATAMRSFVDQQGVPVVDIRHDGGKLVLTQSRYAFLGSTPKPEQWVIPFCYRSDAARSCALIDRPSISIDAPAGVLVPNAGGTGYYRFNLQPADWQALIAQGGSLPAAEALATQDSLWAAFRAGKAQASWLIAAAKAMATNPDSNASTNGGSRLSGLELRGLIPEASKPAYQKLMASIYTPRLQAIGFNPAAGAQASDSPDKQKLRQALLNLVVDDAKDPATRAKLEAAATAYLAGDKNALDQAYLEEGLTLLVEKGGVPTAKDLVAKAVASEDAIFRESALRAVSGTGRMDVAQWVLSEFGDPKLRATERLGLVSGLATTTGTVQMAGDWILANYQQLVAGGNGIFISSRLPSSLIFQCSVDRAQRIDQLLGPKVRESGVGLLDFERTVETIRHCGELKAAKGAELAAAIAAG